MPIISLLLAVCLFAFPAHALEVAELKTQLADDKVLGKAAKVTVIEYASLSCSHCAEFHAQVLPVIQKEYIDTGKVRLIYRDYPLDAKALNGAKLAHCAARQGGGEKYYAALKLMFEKQGEWTAADTVKEKLIGMGKDLGLEQKALETCFEDKELEQKIAGSRLNGDKLGIKGTPSFFINGEKAENFHTPAEVRRALDAVLAGKSLDQEAKEAAAEMLKVKPADLTLGKDKAKVTVIEYLNVACPHCGGVHKMLLSTLQKDYIDTGKVRLVFREFPMGAAAFHAYMLAHCKGKEGFFDMLSLLIDENRSWAGASAFIQPLRMVAEKAGIAKEAFYACLENRDVEARIASSMAEASGKLGINHSPTIYINGEKKEGLESPDAIRAAVDAARAK